MAQVACSRGRCEVRGPALRHTITKANVLAQNFFQELWASYVYKTVSGVEVIRVYMYRHPGLNTKK